MAKVDPTQKCNYPDQVFKVDLEHGADEYSKRARDKDITAWHGISNIACAEETACNT